MGMRNMQKSLLFALLSPNKELKEAQDAGDYTKVLMQQEELKSYPFGDVWDYVCEKNQIPVGEQWYEEVKAYEQTVLEKRS